MILDYFPAIDQLASLGAGGAVLQTCHRHKMLLVLSSTSKRLRELFYLRSWMTRVVPTQNFQAMVGFLKQVEVPVYTFFIECVLFFSPQVSNAVVRFLVTQMINQGFFDPFIGH